jgi:hypothetical protein
VHEPPAALEALGLLETADLEGLASSSVLDLARKLNDDRKFSPSVLLERLSMADAQVVTGIASESEAHAHDAQECARIIKRRRFERERSAVQRDIDRLQQQQDGSDGAGLEALLKRKMDLIRLIEGLR